MESDDDDSSENDSDDVTAGPAQCLTHDGFGLEGGATAMAVSGQWLNATNGRRIAVNWSEELLAGSLELQVEGANRMRFSDGACDEATGDWYRKRIDFRSCRSNGVWTK